MKKKIVIIITCLVSVIILVSLIIKSIPEGPEEFLKTARNSINKSLESGAAIYSKNDLLEARDLYDEAMKEWNIQNKRFILLRDYSYVVDLAESARIQAEIAENNSIKEKTGLSVRYIQLLNTLDSVTNYYNPLIKKIPLPADIYKKYSRGTILLTEAHIAFNKGMITEGTIKLEHANNFITNATSYAFDLLEKYFKNYQDWVAWKEKTIRLSKKNQSTAILIDKFDKKCHIYVAGKLKHVFNIELGKNWIGDKNLKGDFATPEGFYFIKQKYKTPNTAYHKALLINFPNDEDLKRFAEAKKTNHIPKSAEIGGQIEIHGEGGKGYDWTRGCIALDNNDIDELFKITGINTPVTIVGSLKSFNDILKKNDI